MYKASQSSSELFLRSVTVCLHYLVILLTSKQASLRSRTYGLPRQEKRTRFVVHVPCTNSPPESQWSFGISSVAAFSWFWDSTQKQAERKTEKPVDRSANKQDTGKDCCARCSRCCSTHLRRREDEEDEPLTKGSFRPRLRESWAKKPKEAKFLSELWTTIRGGKFESLWERPRTTVARCIAYAARNPSSKTVNCPLASLGELLRLFKWIDSNSLLAHIPSEARFYATRRDIPPKDLNEREEKREEHPTKNKEQLTKHFVVPLKVFTLATWYL
ncbi:hypothetical protein SELMODRAFT_419750 [Selaginella moellendorffii]|uniref:Uncharacterized protein n=1 Tax=Selaginella moellendorffii TaxID=88036 RepID=D8S9X7_SELML|nr:hypothetical protein SELMODRAFT_419750 [Selaginella moellendorffii]